MLVSIATMHSSETVRSFTQQAESFSAAAVTRLPETLDLLLELAGPAPGQRWLDAACGPGVLTRALGASVGEVLGVDATPAMVALAQREAAADGVANVRFAVGDLACLELPDGALDAAICRFAFHHLPVPGRVLSELRRVVRPGGVVVIADHLADEDADAMAWSQGIERLRDPSHWSCLTARRYRELGEQLGMRLEHERVVPVGLDFSDWLARGPGAEAAQRQIGWAFEERPEQSTCFRVLDGVLTIQLWIGRWRR